MEKLQLFRQLAIDLNAGTLSRTVGSNLLGNGTSKQVPAFKLLSLHINELKGKKFSLIDRKDENKKLLTIDIPLMSEG